MRACSLFLAAILNFDGHFESYINYYKSETFLMPSKTFVDIFIGLLQEIVLCGCLKRFFSIKSRPSWNKPPLPP
mgnify:CR=1 FL=1